MYLYILTLYTLIYVTLCILRLNFHSYSNTTNRVDEIQTPHSSNILTKNSTVTLILISYAALTWVVCEYSGSEANLSTEFWPLTYVALTFLFAFFGLKESNSSGSGASIENIYPFMGLYALFSICLCLVTNTTHLYLLFEIGSYLNILMLLFNLAKTRTLNTHVNLVAISITFLVNFLASLVFYFFLYTTIYESGLISFLQLTYVSPQSSCQSLFLTLFCLIKFNVGPWIVGGVLLYKGYSMRYLYIYSIISLTFLTPILFQLLISAPAHLIILGFVISTGLIISLTSGTSTSAKHLLSYSTSLLYIYILCLIM